MSKTYIMQATVLKASMSSPRNYIITTGPMGYTLVDIIFTNNRGTEQVTITS